MLGPCMAESARGPVNLGPPQRRALLLCLLLEQTRPVSVDRLAELLWAGRPPASATSSIHAHVCRLRAALSRAGAATQAVLLSTGSGYALHVPPHHRDTTVFERTLEYALDTADRGQTGTARAAVDQALALWRGQPFAELKGHPVAQQETSYLEELRRTAHNLRARLLLSEGRFVQAALAAEQLIADSPFLETAWVTLLKALCGAGRSAEALGRYEMIRHLLADVLGTSPGPELQRVHLALLRHTRTQQW